MSTSQTANDEALEPKPHSHKIPTIAKYREEREARRIVAQQHSNISETIQSKPPSNVGGNYDNRQGQTTGGDQSNQQTGQTGPVGGLHSNKGSAEDSQDLHDTSEATIPSGDAKERRHYIKRSGDERAERQVTDPVTHLPVTIQDLTSDALKDVAENDPPFGSTPRTATGLSNKEKSDKYLQADATELENSHDSMKGLFPPPEFDSLKNEFMSIATLGTTVALTGAVLLAYISFTATRKLIPSSISDNGFSEKPSKILRGLFLPALAVVTGGISVITLGVSVREWISKRIARTWDERVWESSKQEESKLEKTGNTETTAWLNSLLSSVWPLINPDLFLSLSDTLEDVMQASLSRAVQMVSVDDIGQGTEAIRILGVKWLPSGAAARSVDKDGSLRARNTKDHLPEYQTNDADVRSSDQKHQEASAKCDKGEQSSQHHTAGGMEAEEGDFVNFEIAFAYRARSGKRGLRERAQSMHLHMAFYLIGNVKLPVWVELHGVVGIMRLRLQLCPDPPFFSLCTMTFLGQPKVNINCTPLNRHALNIMDLPLISNFVQSSIDAAMAEYVAPKSLSLDLKQMLEGDDFKKNTVARGVLVVRIIKGYDFKCGDTGVPMISKGTSDPYVSVGWAKFGKPMWSTRILISEMEPVWEETAYLLVTPAELDVNERLRLQLWDSDKLTADDDLGRIEVDLKQLMRNEESNGKMWSRSDGFRALKAEEEMPGKLEWSVGYYAKTKIQPGQLKEQTFDSEVRTIDQLKDKVDRICERKLREAQIKGRESRDAEELKQQKAQELKSREDSMIISAPPPDGFPSGVFSIQIHQITGLELQDLSNSYDDREKEQDEDLPSAYCTVIINHRTIFRTRTKPKNARPFYNASTERFIADWRAAEVFVAVRDARFSEDDLLLGIVHLPLADIFHERSQVNAFYPIAGGVGFGRMRLSMVWRSVDLQVPTKALGWDYGTVEVHSGISQSDVPHDLGSMTIRFNTDLGTGKMHAGHDEKGWTSRKDRSLRLAVRKRYASCLTVRFRKSALLGKETAAFAVLWLQNIADDEEREVTLTVWKGDYNRARTCSIEECGEKVGSIKLKLAFWSGLGAAHSKWASKDASVSAVVEVLETARDNLEQEKNEKHAGVVHDESSPSDSESSDSSDEDNDNHEAVEEGQKTTKRRQNSDGETSGLVERVKDRAGREKTLNRKNRGLMQWKAPRKAQWAVHHVEKAGSLLPDIFSRHSRDQGIETEV